MNRTFHTVVVIAVSLAGCSAASVPPAFGPDHPASARAPETPPPPPSQALAGDALVPPPAERGKAASHAGHHGSGSHGTHGGH